MAKAQTIVKLTAETNDYEKKMRQATKSFNDFMKGVGLSPAKLNAMAVAIGATTAAMKVAKDAFMYNEKQLDEWGRTVAAAKGVYEGFLNAINTGDISGFLSNISAIQKAARDAYDALDELATFNAFNKANIAGARADFTGSVADYREGTGSKESVKAAGEALIKELETKQKLQMEAYTKTIGLVAGKRGVNADDLLKVMTGSWGSFKELKDTKLTGSRMVSYSGGMFGGGGSYIVAAPNNERERLAQAVQQLNDTEIDNFQSLAESAKMTQVEINNQRKMMARILNGNTGGGGGGGRGGGGGGNNITYASDSIAAQEKLIQDLTKAWREASAEFRAGYLKQLKEAESVLEDMKNPMGQLPKPTGEQLESIGLNKNLLAGATFADLKEGRFTVPTEELARKFVEARLKDKDMPYLHRTEDGFTYVSGRELADGMASAMSGITSSIEQLGIDIPDGFKTVISAMQGISTILTAINTTLAIMKAIDSADFFKPLATGGIVRAAGGYFVPGNYNSGDLVPALLNSGELVLNRAQQGNLASQLQNPMGNMNLTASLSGETITLAVKAGNLRRGRGEYVTSKTKSYGYNLDA